MNILITGAKGQLGKDCRQILSQNHTVHGCDIENVDITNKSQVAAVFSSSSPDIVINCAAYTAVDRCEDEQSRCRAINAKGPEVLAEYCNQHHCRFIQISTDYVFDGHKPFPNAYQEDDQTHPLSVYGEGKLAGEKAAQLVEKHLILRTAWLFGAGGHNFLKTMLRLALADPKKTIRVVDDQYGSLTWSHSLARQIECLLNTAETGIFHTTSEGYSSWYEAARFFLDRMEVPYTMEPCTSEEYPTPAHRPANSILNNSRLNALDLNVMQHWQQDVEQFVTTHGDSLIQEFS